VGGRFCSGYIGGREGLYWVCQWEVLYWMGWLACNCMEMKILYPGGKNPYPQDVL